MKAHRSRDTARVVILAAAAASQIFAITIAARAQSRSIIPVVPIPAGDFNFDGQASASDGPFMASALVDPTEYQAQFGLTAAQLLQIGDINGDAAFNNQ